MKGMKSHATPAGRSGQGPVGAQRSHAGSHQSSPGAQGSRGSHQSPGARYRSSTVPRHLFAACADVTVWSLPEELLVHLLRGLHITDLLNMRSVHPAFRDLIDANATIWQAASFDDTWPSVHNIKHFERAAKHRNLESLLKLAIAYLYNEGLPHDEEGQRMRTNGMMAAAMFCEVETLTPNVTPFTWLFIRPPWSAGRACCKECVFKNMLLHVKQHQDTHVSMCVSQILRLFEDPESQARMVRYLTLAARGGNRDAMFQLWTDKYDRNKSSEFAMELQSARELRDIASLGDLEAQLALCRYYAATCHSGGHFMQQCGVSRDAAVGTVRSFLQSSSPSNAHLIFTYHPDISNTMRYILIDWLVEVAGMKEFSTHTLHVAVSVVDRFLRHHKMTRSRLQLLGVAAMVLCSRFLGRDIITIREAAWLTDNTYRYEDVVRMMGEIVATLRGKIRVETSLDYLYVLEELASADQRTKNLAEYLLETALLHAELSRYKRAEVAASCLLLARLVLKTPYPWSAHLQEFTGFTVTSLAECVVNLFNKCFVLGRVTDHRDVELEAVRQRYSSPDFCSVSTMTLPSLKEVCSWLGVVGYDMRCNTPSVLRPVFNAREIRACHPATPNCSGQKSCMVESATTLCCPSVGRALSEPRVTSTLHGTSTLHTTSTTSSSTDGSSVQNSSAVYDSGGYQGDCSMSALDQSNNVSMLDINANDVSLKCLNPPQTVPIATTPNQIAPKLVTMESSVTSSSSSSMMQIHRRSSKAKMAPVSNNENATPLLSSDLSSENPIPSSVRSPRIQKRKTSVLHDRSGRHNIPSIPVEEAMQESPVKAGSGAGSPMKTD